MSDEFLRVAKKEVDDDIAEIGNLLQNCASDDDLYKNVEEIEKHVHKIKGLAPMMGQSQVGDAATLLDKHLKTILGGGTVPGICLATKRSFEFMRGAMGGDKTDFGLIKSEIEKIIGIQ